MTMTPSLRSIRQALVRIGIEPDAISDPNLSEDLIRIYFGPEKENATERTSLTDYMEKIEQLQQKGDIPQQQ
jgi:hypothetical protein